MIREDNDLAFLLKYENIAWYENGQVRILDRRLYPEKIEFVTCNSYEEVALAIKNMVTQSGGPYTAAGMAMALAAYQCRNMKQDSIKDYLKKASSILSNARPTTSKKMAKVTNECLDVAYLAMENGSPVDEAIFNLTINKLNDKYFRINKRAKVLVEMFPKEATIMTQCYGETIVGLMIREAINSGKIIRLICPETRPFFQGSRLTASVAKDQGVDVTVITDNMPASVMMEDKVDIFTSAADVITLDGHVVNKVGTLQIALAASYFNVPYFVTGNPDFSHEHISSVEIEKRDGNDVLNSMGIATAKTGVKGYYPAFDITPPKLVNGVITDKGILSPYDLRSFKDMKG